MTVPRRPLRWMYRCAINSGKFFCRIANFYVYITPFSAPSSKRWSLYSMNRSLPLCNDLMKNTFNLFQACRSLCVWLPYPALAKSLKGRSCCNSTLWFAVTRVARGSLAPRWRSIAPSLGFSVRPPPTDRPIDQPTLASCESQGHGRAEC